MGVARLSKARRSRDTRVLGTGDVSGSLQEGSILLPSAPCHPGMSAFSARDCI